MMVTLTAGPARKDEKEAKAMKGNRGRNAETKKGRKKVGPKDILIDAMQRDFKNLAEAQEFESKYKEKLQKKPGNQIFHVLAEKERWPEGMQWPDQTMKEFLDWGLERYHKLLEIKNGDEYSPLHLAIKNQNTTFVDAVLENKKLMGLGLCQILSEKCQYGNSLHIAIKYKLPSIRLLVDKSTQFREIFFDGDTHQNTPLHACMSMGIQRKDGGDEDEDDTDTDIEEGSEGSGGDRPYYDYEGESEAVEEQERRDAGLADWTPIERGQGTYQPTHVRAIKGQDSQGPPLQRRQSPIVPPVTTLRQVPEIVELLVQSNDSVLWHHNAAKHTPYQERIRHLRENHEELGKDGTSTKDKQAGSRATLKEKIAKDPIASYIRFHCMRNFSRDRIMTCLYEPGQERHIEFDLDGLPHLTISEDYLNRLSKHLQFESILKYVALPKLRFESGPLVRRRKKGVNPTSEQCHFKRGLSDLVAVFGWLRDNGVEKIIKVMVIDDEEPSHADTSIVEALKEFNIEQWDWKRLDLCTDIIHQSTPVVKEISLYSTGNNAVLMGWASPESISNKINFPELRKVKLYIRQGLEEGRQREMYIDHFKEMIKTKTQDRVKVEVIRDDKEMSYASKFRSVDGSLDQESPWIQCMTAFARLLRTTASSFRPVKIAIIDDGLDASLDSLDGKIAIGKSFCPYANSTDLMSPYYVPSGNHGTCMAALIAKLVPNVRLYIARLDERQSSRGGQRQITAKSAADAICWATSCGVDIISISWTIETPVAGNKDMESLRSAVEAARKETLMFCSTSDQGSLTKDHCYPGDFDRCIKIGGATDTGEALAWVNAEKVDFLLPGKDVAFLNNEGKIASHESGSSVATAAATGLAGLLLCCSWLLCPDNKYLQNGTTMREVFKTMASADKQFPRVQEYFDSLFKKTLLAREDKQVATSYDLSTMPKWDENCTRALSRVMDHIKGLGPDEELA